jgi:mono/diheme cytochrome c family protein
MKKVFGIIIAGAFLYACSGGQKDDAASTTPASEATSSADNNANPSYDPKRGEGKFTTVDIADHLDAAKADAGKKVYDVKCSACHKLTNEKLVGPGWAGVTTRHEPVWIMNFVTNTDEMIDKDPSAQAQLEICLVRMPNQNLSDDDARNLLEFMRRNDGVK